MNNYTDKTNYDFNASYIADIIAVASYRAVGEELCEEVIAMIMAYGTHTSPSAIALTNYKKFLYNGDLVKDFKFAFKTRVYEYEDGWVNDYIPKASVGKKYCAIGHQVLTRDDYDNSGRNWMFIEKYLEEVFDFEGLQVADYSFAMNLKIKRLMMCEYYNLSYTHEHKVQTQDILLKALRKMGSAKFYKSKVYKYEEITDDMCLSVFEYWLLNGVANNNDLDIDDTENFSNDIIKMALNFRKVFEKVRNDRSSFIVSDIINKIRDIIYKDSYYLFAKETNKLLKFEQRDALVLPFYPNRYNDEYCFPYRSFLNTECGYKINGGFKNFLNTDGGIYSNWSRYMDKRKMILVIEKYNKNNNDKLKFSKSWTYKRLYQLWNTEGKSEEARLNKVIFNRVLKVITKRKITKENVKGYRKSKRTGGISTGYLFTSRRYANIRAVELRNDIVEDYYY